MKIKTSQPDGMMDETVSLQLPTNWKWLGRTVKGLLLGLLGMVSSAADEANPFVKQEPPPLVGAWDLVVHGAGGDYPSWLQISQSGYRTLVGSYVGQFGSARPVARIEHDQGRLRFSLPPQWERRTNDVVVEGRLAGDGLRGEITDDDGKRLNWEARRAPALRRETSPSWGKPIELFNRRDLTGWRPRHSGSKHGWQVQDGCLTNVVPGNDLMTEQLFNDFKLHAEFRFPKGSNSGLYLRGRYEVQIEDNFGQEPDCHRIGGVYGFLSPFANAAKPAGEWQTLDVTLVGRFVTVVLNGERIIERQAIPGITGGALDSDEAKPGPILVQGDHGPIAFRKLTLTPGK